MKATVEPIRVALSDGAYEATIWRQESLAPNVALLIRPFAAGSANATSETKRSTD
jgi:hypothetical protein